MAGQPVLYSFVHGEYCATSRHFVCVPLDQWRLIYNNILQLSLDQNDTVRCQLLLHAVSSELAKTYKSTFLGNLLARVFSRVALETLQCASLCMPAIHVPWYSWSLFVTNRSTIGLVFQESISRIITFVLLTDLSITLPHRYWLINP